MAKSLDERIAAAMADSARIATVQGLVTEVGEAIAATQAEHDAAHVTSISATVSEVEADAAADATVRLGRKIQRLTAKKAQLEDQVTKLQTSARQQRLAVYDEGVVVRRDQLAADLRDRWPALVSEMVSLIERISKSDAECASVGHHVVSAEALARNVAQNFHMPNHGHVSRFIDMRIVNLTGLGWDEFAWPPREMPFFSGEANKARQDAALGIDL